MERVKNETTYFKYKSLKTPSKQNHFKLLYYYFNLVQGKSIIRIILVFTLFAKQIRKHSVSYTGEYSINYRIGKEFFYNPF